MLSVRHKRSDGTVVKHDWDWPDLAAVLIAVEDEGKLKQLYHVGEVTLDNPRTMKTSAGEFVIEQGDIIEAWTGGV